MNWAVVGAGFMALAVALGAFGAHALKARLDPAMLAIFEVGVRYHVYHALGLFVVAWLASGRPSGALTAAGACFSIGILLFSGSLYALALTGVTRWGMIAPIGGALFIAGWVSVALGARRGL